MITNIAADLRTDANRVREAIATTRIPILIISGDHDISAPVENWYALSGRLPTAQHVVFPEAGHAPHHQYPETVAAYIRSFVRTAP